MADFENTTGAGAVNGTGMENSEADSTHGFIVASGFVLLISLIGIIGNSLVFWYLGFRIKRTKYTIYIINLAVADLIYLIFISIVMCVTFGLYLHESQVANARDLFLGLEIILGFGNYAAMFFLTAISVERCMAVLYPIWYRHNRPKFQSITVCAIIWVLSAFVTLLDQLGCPPDLFETVAERCTGVQVFLAVLVLLICVPIMVSSSLILLIRIRRSSKQVHPPKLIMVIVASVIVFIMSVAPMRFLWLLLYLQVLPSTFSAGVFFYTVYFFISTNSSLNPFIYFLVGRNNQRGVREYLKKALKNVFREEEDKEDSGVKGHEEGDTTDSNISYIVRCI